MEKWTIGGLPKINIAKVAMANDVLGPGRRAIVWVQGCRKRCKECMSPEWLPLRAANSLLPKSLAHILLDANVNGVTISGGEPMLQAAGLSECLRIVKMVHDTSVICFSGYTLSNLKKSPPGPGVEDLLGQLDVLIDGPYIPTFNDGRGMRGSTNQHFHFLTNRFAGQSEEWEQRVRISEVLITSDGAMLIGVPASGVLETFHKSIDLFNATVILDYPENGTNIQANDTEEK